MDDLWEFEEAEIEVLGEVIPVQRGGKFSEVFWPFEVETPEICVNL